MKRKFVFGGSPAGSSTLVVRIPQQGWYVSKRVITGNGVSVAGTFVPDVGHVFDGEEDVFASPGETLVHSS